MPWTKTPNVAQYKGADWSNFVRREASCPPERAKRVARRNPDISFFFCCREPMVLEGPVQQKYGAFEAGDAVFFKGEPWWGSAPQCDAYQKNGLTVAYSNPKSPEQFVQLGDHRMADGSPAIDIVCLFAANYASADSPYFRAENNDPPTREEFNPNIKVALEEGVRPLQEKGISVLLDVLNGQQQVGWSQFTDPGAIDGYTDYVARTVGKYRLEGIDIDDEYSKGPANNTSLIKVTTAMKARMPDTIISKALWTDQTYFEQGPVDGHTLAGNLTYGWEMTYSAAPADKLPFYVEHGMSAQRVLFGFATPTPKRHVRPDPESDLRWVKSNGYGGFMVFECETDAGLNLMGRLVEAWYGPGNWNPPR